MSETRLSSRAIEAIRQSCIDAALAGYEDALISGLCREGAWEAGVSAIQRLELTESLAASTEDDLPGDGSAAEPDLSQLTADLARRFSASGPPAAGSGAAVTGATAAGLLAWSAGHTEEHGSAEFRSRAHRIRGRAALLGSALAAAAEEDAAVVGSMIDARTREKPQTSFVRPAESVLEIATHSSHVSTLAAELALHAPPAIRSDVEVALRLACAASQSAMDLFAANLPSGDDGSEWRRDVKRRAWRVRLLLRRAASGIPCPDSE